MAVLLSLGMIASDAIAGPGGPVDDPATSKCVDVSCAGGGGPGGPAGGPSGPGGGSGGSPPGGGDEDAGPPCEDGDLLGPDEQCDCVENPANPPAKYCEVSLT